MYKQYNTNQLSLELNLVWNLPATHEARLISQFVDSIPQSVLSRRIVPYKSSSYVAQNAPVRLSAFFSYWLIFAQPLF